MAGCSRMSRLSKIYGYGVILALALSLPAACLGDNETTLADAWGEPQVSDGSAGVIFERSPKLGSEIDRCGEVIDMHFHEAFWFRAPGPILKEMDAAGISRGLLMSPYGAKASPFSDDPNTSVRQISRDSGGRIYGFASLNTTGNWSETEDEELDRLATFLASKPEIVGGKMANPHMCNKLNSDIMQGVVRVVSESPSPTLIVHVGTTPFCGPFGVITAGMWGCCEPEYVDTTYFEPLIATYPNVTFVLMHVGHDFLEPDNEFYYNNTLVDRTLDVASRYPNVYLEISALLKQPLANLTMSKIVAAGFAGRTIYGSDVNHFPGGLGDYLEMAVTGMIDSGFTEEERCLTLSGNAIEAFSLGEYIPSSSAPTVAPVTDETGISSAAPTVAPTAGGNETETNSPSSLAPTEAPTAGNTGISSAAPTVAPTPGGNETDTNSPSSAPTEVPSSASRFLRTHQSAVLLAGIAGSLLHAMF